MDGNSGFEFGSASVIQDSKTGKSEVDSVISSKPVTDSCVPTAKEENRSQSRSLSSSGKPNPKAASTMQVKPVANQSNHQDSFSESSSSAMTSANNTSSVP